MLKYNLTIFSDAESVIWYILNIFFMFDFIAKICFTILNIAIIICFKVLSSFYINETKCTMINI